MTGQLGDRHFATNCGETDEIGSKAVLKIHDIYDIHATMLHLLGMGHTRLTYLHSCRRIRVTD